MTTHSLGVGGMAAQNRQMLRDKERVRKTKSAKRKRPGGKKKR